MESHNMYHKSHMHSETEYPNIEESQRKLENEIGTLYETIFEKIGNGEGAPPYILFASAAIEIMEKNEFDQTVKQADDIDILTTREGLDRFTKMMKQNNDIEISEYQVTTSNDRPAMLGSNENQTRLTCKLNIKGQPVKIDMWTSIDANGGIEGLPDINVEEDVVHVPVKFNKANMSDNEIQIPTFSIEAQKKIYTSIQRKQQEFKERFGMQPKSRQRSLDRLQNLSSVEID